MWMPPVETTLLFLSCVIKTMVLAILLNCNLVLVTHPFIGFSTEIYSDRVIDFARSLSEARREIIYDFLPYFYTSLKTVVSA